MNRILGSKKLVRSVVLAVALAWVPAAAVTAPIAAAGPAATDSRPYCGITWGSLAKSAGPAATNGDITNVRAGRHTCFDRMVVDLRGSRTDSGYAVRYVNQVRQPGSGAVVPLRGGAKLQVVAKAPAYDDAGNPTYVPGNRNELVNVRGWRTFRQIAMAGSFEGQTTFGLGVRARLPFRVFTLDGPGKGTRLVLDVAHKW